MIDVIYEVKSLKSDIEMLVSDVLESLRTCRSDT